jgi:hypothetical protein
MEDMLTTLRAAGGRHAEEDFAAVQADYVHPISAADRQYSRAF